MKKKMSLIGLAVGIANGIFGSGGGIIAVPALKKAGFEPKQAHSCSLAITLPLSVVSAVFYAVSGQLRLSESVGYMIPGIIGAVMGAGCMKRISPKALSRIFGVLLVIAGIRGLVI